MLFVIFYHLGRGRVCAVFVRDDRLAKPLERHFRAVHALKSEIEFLSVMRVKAEISEMHGVVSALFKLTYRVGIAERFAHLAAVNQHKFAVHPKARGNFAGQRLALRNFVFVVNGDMIHAAGVYVEHVAEIHFAHSRTFYMPAGISRSPRTVPLHNVFLGGFFPNGKVCRVAFFAVHFNARAGLLFVKLNARKFAVVVGFGYIEIYAVGSFVSKPFFDEPFYKVEHDIYMLGSSRRKLGFFDIEFFKVVKEHAFVKSRYFVRAFFLFAGGFLHFVFAVVAVGE